MPDIRWVCLSDMHFGAETSLLTNLQEGQSEIDPSKPSAVLEGLAGYLRELIEQNEDKSQKPKLILNGDILELALAEDQIAAMAFKRLIDLVMPPGGELFSEIIYNPGNHDHHLWESARETQYVGDLPDSWEEKLSPPRHATPIFNEQRVSSYFLTQLVRKHPNLKNMNVQTVYPNLGLMSEDESKCILFHHGHFIESIYLLMSTLKTKLFRDSLMPQDVQTMELENFAWIDFFWSALGRSGQVGEVESRIYEKLQDPKQVKELLDNLLSGLSGELPSFLVGPLRDEFLSWVSGLLADKICGLTRNIAERRLGDEAEKGLRDYIEGPLLKQVKVEEVTFGPQKITFIFGHSHKPFEDFMSFAGYPVGIRMYNSGGWVVDAVETQPLHGGAAILIDENYEAVSLQLYSESGYPNGFVVRVLEARGPGEQQSAFFTRMDEIVTNIPWTDFSDAVTEAIKIRKKNLADRIKNSKL